MVNLSHSAITMYNGCPLKYKYHYIDRYRSKTLSSALFFGGYIGEAVQLIALDKKPDLTSEEKQLVGKDPYKFFDQLMKKVDINGTIHDLKTCDLIRYYLSDYDGDILTMKDRAEIQKLRDELGFYLDGRPLEFEDYRKLYKSGKLDADEYRFMNLHFYLSLIRKGHMMIDSYKSVIMPLITKVYSIERKIQLDCSMDDRPTTDSLIGYIDMIADIELDAENAERCGMKPGDVVKVLLDHKTAGTKYTKNRVRTDSQQLSLYEFSEQIGLCGYIVAVKKIKKPKIGPRKGEVFCDMQVLIDKIPDEVVEEYVEASAEVLDKIYDKEFEPDKGGCNSFGSKCPYYYTICPMGENKNEVEKLHCKGKR